MTSLTDILLERYKNFEDNLINAGCPNEFNGDTIEYLVNPDDDSLYAVVTVKGGFLGEVAKDTYAYFTGLRFYLTETCIEQEDDRGHLYQLDDDGTIRIRDIDGNTADVAEAGDESYGAYLSNLLAMQGTK